MSSGFHSQHINMNSCIPIGKNYINGFHVGKVSANSPYVVFMLQATVFFVISRSIHYLLKPLKQPKIITDILAAILLGPSFLGCNRTLYDALFPHVELTNVNTEALLGGIYFMFIEAVKLDTDTILRTAKYAWNISITCILFTFVVTYCLTSLLRDYFPGVTKQIMFINLCIILSLTFFPVVTNALAELKLLNSELGRLAISCAVLNEMATWVFLAMSMMWTGTIKQKIQSEVSLGALLLIAFFVIRPAIGFISRSIPEGKPVKEVYIVGFLILPLVMGLLTEINGMTPLPGALLVGLLIPPGPPLGSAIVEKCENINNNILIPFFYMSVGQLTNIYSITDWKVFASMFMILIGTFSAKMLASLFSLLYFKTCVRHAILLSLILNLRGINELLLALRWRRRELIDEATYTSLILSNTILISIVTPLIEIYYKPQETLETSDEYKPLAEALQAMPENVELRVLCGVHDEGNVHSIITLLKSLNPVEGSPITAYVLHLQELVGRAAPHFAPYKSQRKKLLKNSTDRIINAISNNFKGSSYVVNLETYAMICPYNVMHQSICSIAREKKIPLILLPFHRSVEVEEKTLRMRSLTKTMEQHSPCTVGIFVDRGLPFQLNTTRSFFHVACFFLCGPDDREAVALVSRMSDHPSVRITLFRIIFKPDHEKAENHNERMHDDSVLSDFLSKNANNNSVVLNKVLAYDTMEVIDAIRAAEFDYDLVVVGKQRVMGSQLDQEMTPWVEHKELGIIGDMLVSKDFCGGMMFVLVIQHSINVMDRNKSKISSFYSDKDDRDINDQGIELILFFFLSRLLYFLLKPLHQSVIVCNALAGILLGPSALGHNKAILEKLFPESEMGVVNTFGVIGGLYYIFLETVKIDKERIIRTAEYAWNVSHVITEFKLLNTELGQLTISCSILNEIAAYFIIALSLCSTGTIKDKIESTACFCAVLCIAVFSIRPLILWIIKNVPEEKPVDEIVIVGLLILPFAYGFLSDMLGMTFWLGVILVGLVIPPGLPLGSALVERFENINSSIFLPFLYLSLGQLTNICSIRDGKGFRAIFFILLAPVLGKMLGSLFSLFYFKTSIRNAVLLSLLLNFRGVLDFTMAQRFRRNELMDEATYTAFILTNIFVATTIGPLINIFYKPQMNLEERALCEPRMITLQAMPVNAELRVLCGVHCEENVPGIITLLKAFTTPTETSQIRAHIVHLQELVGRRTPLLAAYNHRKRRILFPNSTDRIMRKVSNNIETCAVSLFAYTIIAPYKIMHQTICSLVQDQSIPLILLPFSKNQLLHGRMRNFNNLNNNIQGYSPSTVGIFVDRGLTDHLKSKQTHYHVGAFFLGGPDDREAMALVSRMSEKPNFRITLHRIIFKMDYEKEENQSEKNLDDSVIQRFLSKNKNNAGVRFDETDVDSTARAIDLMRSIQKDYDLVIVGKRRIEGSQLKQDMKPWLEYEELGEMGDFLASKDFCQGTMFVLVIHCVGISRTIVASPVKVKGNTDEVRIDVGRITTVS
ncbi:uncharacterized protein LOC116106114 [Pistacia vera]|uniref:uncharacterized protein LOC116106114 n=1 Tax=Pistacia vera TaxID=55513 RepID=UPI001262F655|nr:uncharacterized protein LOC116106114 [Pistacia vera]